MLWTIFRFELAYHLKRPVTYLYLLLTFLFGFFLMASDAIVVVGGVGLVRRNAPFALAQANSIGTAIGTVFTVALVGTSLLRDFRFRVHELLFTTHLSRAGYLVGRFLGAYAAMLVVFAGIPLGTLLGSLAPWVDPEVLLPFDPWSHIQPFLLLTATTLLVVSAIFFAVGALTRSLVAVYTQGIALLVAWSVTQSWLARLDRDALSNAFDVYGLASLELTTRYWTVAERNALLVPMEGFILANRVIWVAAAVVILLITTRLFRFEAGERRSKRPGRRRALLDRRRLGAVRRRGRRVPLLGTGRAPAPAGSAGSAVGAARQRVVASSAGRDQLELRVGGGGRHRIRLGHRRAVGHPRPVGVGVAGRIGRVVGRLRHCRVPARTSVRLDQLHGSPGVPTRRFRTDRAPPHRQSAGRVDDGRR